jgi:hypothetical protein
MPLPPIMLGCRIMKRLTMSGGIILVTAMGVWTDEYFGLVPGICIALLLFTVINQADKNHYARPSLIKRVCILYCSQQIRKLFIIKNNNPISIFTDILLAVALASITMVIHDRDVAHKTDTYELKQMLESLLYLYGDIMDFAFQYGILKITICAFGVSIFLRTSAPPKTQMMQFCWRLASIVNANLLSQGLLSLIPSTPELGVLQCLASTCLLRMIIPDMEYYLTYLAARQLRLLIPGAAPLFFCATVCLELLPISGQEWIGEMCFTYVVGSVATYASEVPFWGMIFVLVITHYIDYIINSSS